MILLNDPTGAHRILTRHGLPSCVPVLAPKQGIANATWLCDTVVVRISKDEEYLDDLFTETVASPAAYGAGIPTPRLLYFSLESSGEVPPYSVYERIAGTSLSLVAELYNPEEFFTAYGQRVRQLQSEVVTVEDPYGYLDPAWELDFSNLVQQARILGLDQGVVSELWQQAGPHSKSVFAHQDLHADNVLVGVNELPAFIDWGDAGFADPAVDFRYIPLRFLPFALEESGDMVLYARILLHAIDQMAYQLLKKKDYGVYGHSTLEDLNRALQRLS